MSTSTLIYLLKTKLKQTLLLNYFSLFYYYQFICQYGVHYSSRGRRCFTKIHHYLSKYCLFQYRKLDQPKSIISPTYPNKLATPFHLHLLKYFFLIYLIRALVGLSLPALSSTKDGRVVLGTAVWRQEAFYFEVMMAFEAAIGFLILQYAFSPFLLHYKFLAIFAMTADPQSSFPFTLFSLTMPVYLQYSKYRSVALHLNDFIVNNFIIFGSCIIIWLHSSAGLYRSHLVVSIIWSFILWYYVVAIFTVTFANLLAFLALMKYICLKQKLIYREIARHLNGISSSSCPLWSNLIRSMFKYTKLFDELLDYSHFWRPFISFIFFFSVLLIGFILYISLFSTVSLAVNLIVSLFLLLHLLIFGLIIRLCGSIVCTNVKLTTKYYSSCAQAVKRNRQLPIAWFIKQHLMTANLQVTEETGFILLNGYLITYDTARLLVFNILSYFLLIVTN